MSVKRMSLLIVLAMCVSMCFAQGKQPRPTSNISVAQSTVVGQIGYNEFAQFSSIQAAVNAAQPGWTIEILDEWTYVGQVTIDGRETSPWQGVTGGKNGITIVHYPNPANPTARPTISHRDVSNISPQTLAQARIPGELFGMTGNFETNGALRILSAKDVTIDGIIVDGGGPFAFGANGVWESPPNSGRGNCDGNPCPLVHGNAAITMAVAGKITIRNCQLRNAYFGINVKDRNTGGVFGNPNPSDLDFTVPLSGFGAVGNHLIEGNRIHNNVVGIFFESAWDLGSSVRYNLIYNNHRTVIPTIEAANHNAGAFLFKDTYITPIAIYNNTLWNNAGNIMGHWQIGAQHLIFNNIFGPITRVNGTPEMTLDSRFPNRMHNNIFTPQSQIQTSPALTGNGNLFQAVPVQSEVATAANFLEPVWPNASVTGRGWQAAGIRNGNGTIADIGAIPSPGAGRQTSLSRVVPTGVVLVNGTQAIADVRLEEIVGRIQNPTVNFLRWVAPIPDNTNSWPNPPTNVLEVLGPSIRPIAAAAVTYTPGPGLVVNRNRFTITLPQPPAGNDQYGFIEIIVTGTDPATNMTVTSDIAFLPYRRLEYFLDISVMPRTTNPPSHAAAVSQVIAGDTVMLYVTARRLAAPFPQTINQVSYSLNSDAPMLCVSANCPPAAAGGRPLTDDVNVQGSGKAYLVVFTKAGAEIITGSGFYQQPGSTDRLPFFGTEDIIVRPGVPAQVEWVNPIPKVQLGTGVPSTINPGAEIDVTVEVQDRFGNAVDVATQVSVAVTAARNPAGTPVTPPTSIGDAGTPGTYDRNTQAYSNRIVTTNQATGIATFTASATNAPPNSQFDMTATLIATGATDVGALRVGRILDRLQVFYADTGAGLNWTTYYDANASILGRVGDWFQVTVKAVDQETVLATKSGCVFVEPSNPNIIMSATRDGPPATSFTMTNGSVTFWIGAAPTTDTDIPNACLDVSMRLTAPDCSVPDNTIQPGNRCNISFARPTSNILNAVVFGDGMGRPDSLHVRFALDGQSFMGPGAAAFPDSVTLRWPTTSSTAITVPRNLISAADSSTIRMSFRGLTNPAGQPFPSGHTSIVGTGTGLVSVWGGAGATGVSEMFEVLDGTGPIIAGLAGEGIPNTWAPLIVENLRPGVVPDTLIILLSEDMFDDPALPMPLEGASLLYSLDLNPPEPAQLGTPLSIQRAFLDAQSGGFKLVLASGSAVPQRGNWIRLNPAASITDVAAIPRLNHPNNRVHTNNRWVQLTVREMPPSVVSAAYFSNDITGRISHVDVTFDKRVDPVDWFSGGHIKFGPERADSFSVNALGAGFLSVVSADSLTMRVNFSALPPSRWRDSVMTGPTMNFTGIFGNSPSVSGWPAATHAVADSAKPVLAREVLLKIGAPGETEALDANDTLIVIFSETMPESVLRTLTHPVIIQHGSTPTNPTSMQYIPTLRYISMSDVTGPGVTYQRVMYEIVENICLPPPPGTMGCGFPASGDSVFINPTENVGDLSANLQNNAANHRVPLKIDRGDIDWRISIRNNPFKGGSKTTAVLRPGVKGGTVKFNARFRIINNVGNLVRDEEMKNVELTSGTSYEFSWDGLNNNGRVVGTGTYLLRMTTTNVSVCNEDGLTGCEKGKPLNEQRPIGFIRGKR